MTTLILSITITITAILAFTLGYSFGRNRWVTACAHYDKTNKGEITEIEVHHEIDFPAILSRNELKPFELDYDFGQYTVFKIKAKKRSQASRSLLKVIESHCDIKGIKDFVRLLA